MSIINIFLVALGISTDAFAVAFANNHKIKNGYLSILKKGMAFGIAETLMFVIGWLISKKFSTIITSIDHWIAFILLGGIGFHMIYIGLKEKGSSNKSQLSQPAQPKTNLLTLVGTSIDSAAVGVSFAFLDVDIILASVIVCLTCFSMASIGIILSNKVKNHLGEYAEIVGGILLIFIGIFILLEHLAV